MGGDDDDDGGLAEHFHYIYIYMYFLISGANNKGTYVSICQEERERKGDVPKFFISFLFFSLIPSYFLPLDFEQREES